MEIVGSKPVKDLISCLDQIAYITASIRAPHFQILIFMLNCMHAHKWLLTKISQALLETRLMVPYLLEQNKKMQKFKK